MLTAAQNHKLKRTPRLLEDEVTSIVFGSLRLVNDPAATWDFIRKLLENAPSDFRPEKLLPQVDPSTLCVDFRFWPRLAPASGGGEGICYVEPDLIIEFKNGSGRLMNVLFEFKWGAGLQPPCELVRQWEFREHRDEPWLHFYVTGSIVDAKKGVKDSLGIARKKKKPNCCEHHRAQGAMQSAAFRGWKRFLIPSSWAHVRQAAASLCPAENAAVGEWAAGVDDFLKNQGFIPFTGFRFDMQASALDTGGGLPLPYREKPWFQFDGEPLPSGQKVNIYRD
jgi:hypothetical protein